MNFNVLYFRIICCCILIYFPLQSFQDAVTKETINDIKEEVQEMILDGEDMYLRAMTIMMDAGARYFCWSMEMEDGQVFNLNYKVLTSDESSGRGHYVGFKLSGSQNQVYHHVVSDSEGKLEQWRPPNKDLYQLCFDGVYSAKADKRVSFYLLVEGKADPTWGLRLDTLEAEEVMEDIHIDMKESISSIKKQINQAKRTQWIRRASMSKDIMRNEALKSMIDKWSFIHVLLVIAIALVQVYVFRDMFSSGEKKLSRHRMGAFT